MWSVTKLRTEAALVLLVRGEISDHADLESHLLVSGDETVGRHVIIDLSMVVSLELDAVGALYGTYWRVHQRGERCSIVAPTPRIRAVLGMTAADWLIPIYDSRAAAEHDTGDSPGYLGDGSPLHERPNIADSSEFRPALVGAVCECAGHARAEASRRSRVRIPRPE